MRKRKTYLIALFLLIFTIVVVVVVTRDNNPTEPPKINHEREYIEKMRQEAQKQLQDAKDSDTSRINTINDALRELGAE